MFVFLDSSTVKSSSSVSLVEHQTRTKTSHGSLEQFRIVPLNQSECLDHVETQFEKDEDYGNRAKRSCKFLPGPEEVASKCQAKEIQAHMESFIEEKEMVERYVMFLATAHSGHSLVGSLLDAHPMMLVANEGDIFGRWMKGELTSREDIFQFIFLNSLSCALYSRWQHGYNYTVPGGWNGHWLHRNLRVIGDKKGGTTRKMFLDLQQKGQLAEKFKQFQDSIGLPIHIIHVFWDKDSKREQETNQMINVLKQGANVSAFEWDNAVYTCDENNRRALLMNACSFLGVPCDSTIIEKWEKMASCRAASKYTDGL